MIVPHRNFPMDGLLRAAALALPAALLSAPLAAQNATSREVVQPLPSKETQRLNRALLQLAKRPTSVAALVEAGEAATEVGDLDAAIGFYSRADEFAPSDWRVKLGMARVFLRSGRPVDALPLFAAAQTAGADAREVLSDRALAFDLVGDPENAQTAYRRAIALDGTDNESKRRLAVSYAISGNREGFEDTLRPMIDRRDFASFRARAFGLAIMGEQDRAAAIVDAVMPRDLAGRINPYLAYMPRLTKAQQAAAANLGIFPKVADIGREDPRIAAYTSGSSSTDRTVRTAGNRLEPAGEPLGRPTTPATEPSFDLTQTGSATPSVPSESVADAFADIGDAELANAGGNAVDLAAIEIPREATPEPEPAKPDHPARIWVQLATGRDTSALRFDWRRFARQAPELLGDFKPHVTPWGQANRLLAGPLASRAEARELINALKAKGIDTFRFSSPEGTEITLLK